MNMITGVMQVYKLTNKVTGLAYVGATTRTGQRRLYEISKSQAKAKSSLIIPAVIEYGIEAFEVEVLYRAKSKEDLFEQERQYIQWFDTIRNGYNIQTGGTGNTEQFQWRSSRKKHADALRGKKRAPFSEKTKLKMKLAAIIRAARPEEKQRRAELAKKLFTKRTTNKATGRLI